jgi:pilus assembly protein CpaB
MVGYNPPKGFEHGRKTGPSQKLKIAAGVFGLSMLGVVSLYFQKANVTQAANIPGSMYGASSEVGSVVLYTVSRTITPGDQISDGDIQEVSWSINQVPEGAVRDRSELLNLYAKVLIPQNTPLQRQQFSDRQTQSRLPVTPGNRAVTIEVDATSGLEGFAGPGSKVDVVLTYHLNAVLTTKVIVQNTKVLSLQGNTKNVEDLEVGSRGGAPQVNQTITLDVMPKDALQITNARQLGRLSLIMRSQDDDTDLAVDVVDQTGMDEEGVVSDRPNKFIPASAATKKQCERGTYKVNGKSYKVDCDNNITLLSSGDEDL